MTLTKVWRRWGKWLQVAGTFILFGYLMKTMPVIDALQQLRDAHLISILMSLMLALISLITYAYTWSITLKSLGLSVPFGQVYSLFFQALFINNFASFLGGDLLRSYKLGRDTHRTLDVGVSVLVSRVAMLYALLMLAGATTWLWASRAGWSEVAQWAGAALTVLGLILLKVYRWPLRWVAAWLARRRSSWLTDAASRTVQALLTTGNVLIVVCLASLLAQFVGIWGIWWIATGLQVPVAWWQILLAMSVLQVVLVLPISFNGLGLREVGLVGLLTDLGVDASQALALALTSSFVVVVSSLPGGLLFLKDSLAPSSTNQREDPHVDS